ncbi:hypothetical protein FIBSPDRAFT_887695 [Athelia psychrophila]|uniref:Uncharacterized protein n=1 Tax=Athelia psychrophila TaxID=1759441 RepID=A0A166PFF2_9AGAM|nr:hypothetical protein FIBSPDRAFT_887695 [Fibularhizoctonia sp. CBS 109695]
MTEENSPASSFKPRCFSTGLGHRSARDRAPAAKDLLVQHLYPKSLSQQHQIGHIVALDFEIRQEQKLHDIHEEIAELRTSITALTGLAAYSQMDSSDGSQLDAPSAQTLIERGVIAGWSQM